MLQQQLMLVLALLLVLLVWELKVSQVLGKGMMLCQQNRTPWAHQRKLVTNVQLVMLLLWQGAEANLQRQQQLICHQQPQKAGLCSGIRGDDPHDHAPAKMSMASACVWTCIWCFCMHDLFSTDTEHTEQIMQRANKSMCRLSMQTLQQSLHLMRSHATMSVLHSGKAGKQPSMSRRKR